ncbi:uncharacterized protein [Leptinotarsa decemlineata]|uniref:uncharacterized protein n=1 Tax=Leptinotarsa decemlineata TaxID=7539 RepID=UPI003D30B0D0
MLSECISFFRTRSTSTKMAFKIVVLTTLLAYANAGLIAAPAVATYSAAPAVSSSYIHQASPVAVAHAAPLAVAHAAPVAVAHAAPVVSTYASSPVAIHAPAYGATHQSVERSLGGAQSVSHYSKAVDSAFSSVRKYDTRITNDALSVAHAPVVSAYSAAPVYAKAVAPAVAYSAAPSFSSSYIQKAAPLAYASYAHAAPVATYAHAAPVATYAAHAAPVATYSAHAAPVAAYAAHAAPVASYSAGPVVTKAAVAYSPAAVVSHMTFSGLGTAYQCSMKFEEPILIFICPQIVVLTTLLAYANAGLIAAPAVAYSAAPAVSSSYIHQATPVASHLAVAHAAPLAVAHAAPVAVAHAAPVEIHAPAYGSTHQSVERSLGGAQSVSHYSKAVDSAFSSVRKYDTRITNDALSVAHAPVVSAYSAAPVYAKAVAPAVAYSAAPSFSSSYIQKAAPLAYASYAHAAPVATYAHAAPVATYAHAAPIATYAAHAAPVAAYAAHAAPVAAYSAGPVVAKAAVAYSPAAVVSHMTFNGLGTAYQW